jgi:hypothetical protein
MVYQQFLATNWRLQGRKSRFLPALRETGIRRDGGDVVAQIAGPAGRALTEPNRREIDLLTIKRRSQPAEGSLAWTSD